MIRRGRTEGWLYLPLRTLPQWALLNGVSFRSVDFKEFDQRGAGVILNDHGRTTHSEPLVSVPKEIILSKENVLLHAKTDRYLQQVLDSVGEFGRTARGAILIFLLIQATYNCPEIDKTIGRAHAFTEYIKFLHEEMLPTFWTLQEFELMKGTSLAPAMDAKMKSLYREFDQLRSSTESIEWCQKYWWDEIDGLLAFDDWLQVDCMYRSRALEFPGIGDAMVPCVDMANHASNEGTNALYEADRDGNGLLLVRGTVDLQPGNEITITYGDEKGACEMIFSYGFLEDMEHARDIFLGLQIPDDDPLGRAKRAVATTAPGVRLFGGSEGLKWESEYIWLICVNEEDGLHFEVAMTTDGERELKINWKEEPLTDTSKLRSLLESDPLWDIYHLRAVTLIQDRVWQQLENINASNESDKGPYEESNGIRNGPLRLITRLRTLEKHLLELFHNYFEDQKMTLMQSEIVEKYLSNAPRDDSEMDDFS